MAFCVFSGNVLPSVLCTLAYPTNIMEEAGAPPQQLLAKIRGMHRVQVGSASQVKKYNLQLRGKRLIQQIFAPKTFLLQGYKLHHLSS